jgi:heat shock protein HtpX
MNYLKTGILMVCLAVILIWIGGLVGGARGAIIAFLFALIINGVSYWFSDKIVLKMYRAKEVGPNDFPGLYNAVSQLAHSAALPMPRIYTIPEESPNAFATGRNPEHAVIAVTEGLLKSMDDEEATGVLAHEMSHIKNRDILIGSIAATMAGAIMILATMARWTAFLGEGHATTTGGAVLALSV